MTAWHLPGDTEAAGCFTFVSVLTSDSPTVHSTIRPMAELSAILIDS